MTAPAKVASAAEAQELATAYQLALGQIGVATVADLIELWSAVPATQRAAQATRWLNQAVSLVLGHRRESSALGLAYYRLTRALLTGITVADPARDEPASVTLGELREQFHQLATARSVSVPPGGHGGEDKTPISVEKIPGFDGFDAQAEKAAEQELRIDLAALGPDNLERKVSTIDSAKPAVDVDKERQQAHNEAGARQAAAGARVAMNGARSTSWFLQQGDKRALGWVRISTTGTPCGWCAMLISRGVTYKDGKAGLGTLYASERSASFNYDDGDTYHDNCRCIAIPVFDADAVSSSPIFQLNRKYGEQWPKATEGLGGKDALSAWRRFIRQEQKGAS